MMILWSMQVRLSVVECGHDLAEPLMMMELHLTELRLSALLLLGFLKKQLL